LEDYPKPFPEIWAAVEPYTMTSRQRGFALWSAVNHVVDCNLPGAFVECGVWRGGSAMLMALTLLQRGAAPRELFLFDTFSGMTEPGDQDVDLHGRPATALLDGSHGEELSELVKAEAPLDHVREAMASTGYDMRLVHLVPGDVRETLPVTQTLHLALLRLDTDFYDSTLCELEVLYPRLVKGGILIIDDFGLGKGARAAVEQYFGTPEAKAGRPLLWTIEDTGRGGVKVDDATGVEVERYDYRPPGFEAPDLLPLFPHAQPSDPWSVNWPYLRKEVPHIWRSDSRHRGVVTGNASVEEGHCLFQLALQFRGRRGLEIGTHYGWTAAHIVAAGVKLDCVDPALADPQRRKDVSDVLDAVEGSQGYTLWADASPQCIPGISRHGDEPWSFAFIDGNHAGDAPAQDARAVLPFLAQDALVVFHDLTSPFVEAGLDVLRQAGLSTGLFETQQIIGLAWRGDIAIPGHTKDRNVPPIWAAHLQKYRSLSL
jgi:predicted O-methyltransferase YrrM